MERIPAIFKGTGILPILYYRWSKDLLVTGRMRLMGNILREANSSEVYGVGNENEQRNTLVAKLALKNHVLQ